MTKTDMNWADVENLVKQIIATIKANEWRPTMVVALSRGGFVPATMIAYGLDVKTMGGLPVVKDDAGSRSLGRLLQFGDLAGQKVLIVDDGIISGHLLPLAAESVRSRQGEARTCALVSLGRCPDPDYLAKIMKEIPKFPWE